LKIINFLAKYTHANWPVGKYTIYERRMYAHVVLKDDKYKTI